MIYSARNTQFKKLDTSFKKNPASIKPYNIKNSIKTLSQTPPPKTPFFTIILWAKNPTALKYIIQSILEQYFQDYQILIAHKISQNLPTNPKIKYIFLQENSKHIVYKTLLTKVHSGYIIWLEPNEKFTNRSILTKIKQHLTSQRIIIYPIQNILQFCIFHQYKQLFLLENNVLIKQFIQHYKLQLVKVPHLINKLTPGQLYPELFHKYELKLYTPYQQIVYNIINGEESFNKTIVAHLHCYNINEFFDIYGDILNILYIYFKVIVTFSIGTKIPKHLTCLLINNRGKDIGSKFCVIDYLKDKDYTHILFLHSKSNPERRSLYFSPLINNLEEIIDQREEYDGIFPDIKWEMDTIISRNKRGEEIREVNHLYRNQLLDYLEIEDRKDEFIEGNVYFLTRKVSERIFGDIALYNILNLPTDFDYNYIMKKYNTRGNPATLFKQYGLVEIPSGENYGNIEQSFERIVLNCCKRNRIVNNTKEKICIIYVYYERKNEQKNQTNLAYFIKYGLDKSRWRDIDITTLIIINGHQCEVMIPERDDIIVWKRDYNDERDIGSYRLGIEYLEHKYNKAFYKKFNYLFIINAGTCGPIYEQDKMNHWLDPFLNKIKYENSIICSPVINFLRDTDSGGPGPRCQSYCSLIKINRHIYNLLLYTKIANFSEKTTNTSIPFHENYVLTTHINKENIILIGEYGLTRILLNNKYNISCLIYDNINYLDETIWQNYSDRVDRSEDYKPEYFEKTIFIKNNWFKDKYTKDSLPVMYNETINYINNKLKYESVFNNIDYDYNLLDELLETKILNYNTNIIASRNNKEYYKLFAYSEERIIWPTQKKNNKALVIYCHYDKDNIVKDYVIQSLKTLIILEYDIIFATTCATINNIDLPFKVFYFKNNTKFKAGNDIIMWNNILKTENINKYNNILLLNDSIILPIHGISNMRNTIQKYRKNCDFWGIYKSNEKQIHLCSCCIEYNIKCIPYIIDFNTKQLLKCNETQDIINNIEIQQTLYLTKFNFRYNYIISYANLNKVDHSIMFNPINIHLYLNNKECFGIKWKYIANYINYNNINNPYFNYLLRYIKLDTIIPDIPNYF